MARITVEDCLEKINNRFDLVVLASRRARDLANGSEATLPWENDKATVVALREVAEGNVGWNYLQKKRAEKRLQTEVTEPAANE
jgi:DNA-directed RNA polymerase subunit omega